MKTCVVCGGDFDGTRAPPEWSYEDVCRACARWASPFLDLTTPTLMAERFKHMLERRRPIKVSSSLIPYPFMKEDR